MTMKYNYEAIEIASNHIKTTVQEIDDKMLALEKKLESLQEEWSGEQTVAYNDSKAAWNRQIEQMKQTLDGIGAKVRDAATRMDDTDRDAARQLTIHS